MLLGSPPGEELGIGQREPKSHDAILMEAEAGMLEWEGQVLLSHISESVEEAVPGSVQPWMKVFLLSKRNPCKGLGAEGLQCGALSAGGEEAFPSEGDLSSAISHLPWTGTKVDLCYQHKVDIMIFPFE